MKDNQRIKAVGFDLGETLIFYPGMKLSWQDKFPLALEHVARACATQNSPERLDSAISILTRYNTRANPRSHEVSSETIFSEILTSWSVRLDEYLPAAIDAFFSFFQQNARLYDDTLPCLDRLAPLRLPLGILSDVPYGMPHRHVELDLQRTGIESRFSIKLTSVDSGQRKPEAKGFHMLASRFGFNPEEIAYVGNEEKDIQGANTAGMVSILINRDGKRKSFGECYQISSLTEMARLIR